MLASDGQAATEARSGAVLDAAVIANGGLHTATAKATALNTKLLAIPIAEVKATLQKAPEWKNQLASHIAQT